MTGLLVKDYRLLWNQKQSLLMVLLVDLFLLFLQRDAGFVLGYSCIILAIFSIGTIAYDEQDNGYAFLFTLPFSRTEYVLEKYFFSVLTSVGGFLLISVPATLYNMRMDAAFDFAEWILVEGAYLVVGLLMQSLMIPLNLKFGSLKARGLTFAVMAAFVAVVILFVRLAGTGTIAFLSGLFDWMDTLSLKAALCLVAGLTVLMLLTLMGLSLAASIHIMRRKEF